MSLLAKYSHRHLALVHPQGSGSLTVKAVALAGTGSLEAGEGFNVMDYGAHADGVTDDVAHIEAAITAADGAELYFPAGTYHLASSLTVPSGTILSGDGVTSWIEGAIRYGSDCTFSDLKLGGTSKHVSHADGADTVAFTNCTFIGGGNSPAMDVMTIGFDYGSISGLTFTDCDFLCNLGTENSSRNLGLNNIGIGTAEGSTNTVTDIHFIGGTIGAHNGTRSGCPRMHIECLSRGDNYVDGLWFIGVTFELSDEHSIDIETDSSSSAMRDIRIEDCNIKGGVYPITPEPYWQQSICLELGQGANVTGNTIGQSRWDSVNFYDRDSSGSSGIVFDDNVLTGTSAKISLTGVHGATVTNNHFTQRAVTIVEEDGASGNTISGNTGV